MAVTSVDTALAGMQPARLLYKAALAGTIAGRPISLWGINGCPSAGTFNTTLNGGVYSSSTNIPQGAIYHKDPAGGVNSYLAGFCGSAPQVGTLFLCDRLWDNQLTINSTGSQSITSPTWPSRDALGGTTGVGVQLAIEVSAATSSTAAALTNVTYTNSGNAGSKTGVFMDLPTAAIAQPGYFHRITQTAGDLGVKSVQSVTFSTAWTTGTVNLVAYRVLAALEIVVAWVPNRDDVLTAGMPQLFNGVCPFLVFTPQAATTGIISGVYQETQG